MAYPYFNDTAIYQPRDISFFKLLKSHGSSGNMTKVSQGGYGGTPYFSPSAPSQIANSNIVFGRHRTGAYHYLLSSSVGDSANEMKWFVDCLKRVDLDKNQLLVLDVEDPSLWGNVTARTNAAIDYLHDAGYRNVGVYYSAGWVWSGKINLGQLHTKLWWTANYGVRQSGVNGDRAWQHTDHWSGLNVDGSMEFTDQGGFFPSSLAITKPAQPENHGYYNWNPRLVKAIGRVSRYKNVNCTQTVDSFPSGTEFEIKEVVHVSGNVYRLKLANGLYLSGWDNHFMNMYYVSSGLKQVKTLQTVCLYKDIERTQVLRSYPKGTLFDVDKIVKMKSGLWEIKTTSGFYMTSNKDYVSKTK